MSWFKKKISLQLIYGIVVLILFASYIFYTIDILKYKKIVHVPPIRQIPILIYERALDGVLLEDRKKTNLRPFAIMIDNAFDARPVIGVDTASLVYETIAEGAITRLLAIYDPENLPENVGPVRSLRPYFLEWAKEVGAIVVHVGGSPEALRDVEEWDNINEFYQGNYFWRDTKRVAPHNLLTSKELLQKASVNLSYHTTSTMSRWIFKDASAYPTSTAVTATVSVNFSTDPYKVTWLYDEDLKEYKRFVNHIPQNVNVKNIIIQVVPSVVIDDVLRRKLFTIGEGRAWIISHGMVQIGMWQKSSHEARTQYINSAGEEIKFMRGKTWIEVIDDEGRVSL